MTNGTHATASDQTFTTLRRALEDLGAGILRLDEAENIKYANQTLCEIWGIDSWKGLSLRDLFAEERSYEEAKARVKRRITEGVGEDYVAKISRRKDNRMLTVNIVAVPEIGPEGDPVGTLALMRDRTLDVGTAAIHEHINEEKDSHEMLKKIGEELKTLVPFDYLSVAIYSADEHHMREMFQMPDIEVFKWGVRWYELTDMARSFMEKRSTQIIADLPAMLAQPEWADTLKQAVTQEFLKMGFRSCLWHPMLQKGRISASIALYSRAVRAFNERDRRIIESLPIRRALLMVLSNLGRQDLQFRLSLIHDIASLEGGVTDVARLLTERIRVHYGWNNVSLFRVDEENQCFRLLNQNPERGEHAYGKDFRQGLDEGVLGHVYNVRHSVNIGNVEKDPNFRQKFRRRMAAEPKSELAIPIIVNGKVCAILNSEDVRENAYSPEEQHGLEQILAEVCGLYRRLELSQTLKAIQDSASDGIIRTDQNGVIRQINPAGAALIGCAGPDIVGRSVTDFLEDSDLAAVVSKAERLAPDEVRLKRCDGKVATLLLSGSPLPDSVGGRVYMLSDLSLRKRIEHLESLGKIYRELGAQSQPAIALCFSWLRRLTSQAEGSLHDTLDKTIRQLRKVQLTFDRLSLAERKGGNLPFNPVLLSVPRLVELIVGDFPKSDVQHVRTEAEDVLPMIYGDMFQISFCIKSILAYLLRFVPEDDKVEIGIIGDGEKVRLCMRGKTPEIPKEGTEAYERSVILSHLRFELALGIETIENLMQQNSGSFNRPIRSDGIESFELVFPISMGES